MLLLLLSFNILILTCFPVCLSVVFSSYAYGPWYTDAHYINCIGSCAFWTLETETLHLTKAFYIILH